LGEDASVVAECVGLQAEDANKDNACINASFIQAEITRQNPKAIFGTISDCQGKGCDSYEKTMKAGESKAGG
jgi:hypothetical protein